MNKTITISETTPSWKRIERRNKLLRDLIPKRGDKYKISLIRIARKKCVRLRKSSKWSTIIVRKTWKSVTTCSTSTLRTYLSQIALLVLSWNTSTYWPRIQTSDCLVERFLSLIRNSSKSTSIDWEEPNKLRSNGSERLSLMNLAKLYSPPLIRHGLFCKMKLRQSCIISMTSRENWHSRKTRMRCLKDV